MTWPKSCIRPAEPLANHTSFRIGGPAEWFAEPSTLDELVEILHEASREGLPISMIGGGTNTLASDGGISGVIIHLGSAFKSIQELSHPEDPVVLVKCGAAIPTQRLVMLAAQRGWGDLNRLAGLPGHLGGAVVMNAQDIGQFVECVDFVSLDGTLRKITHAQLRFAYRSAVLAPGLVTGVVLRFQRIAPEEASKRTYTALRYRNDTQEIRLPSAGCAFINPPGLFAGRLIDEVGLKGARIGDAQVSNRHANFIVNLGHATCEQVLALMEHIRRCVEREVGVELKPEVRLLGNSWHPLHKVSR